VIAERDKVETRLIAYGRHEGHCPPRARNARDRAGLHRIADGKIAEHWSDRDDLALMQQLGIIPLPPLEPRENGGGDELASPGDRNRHQHRRQGGRAVPTLRARSVAVPPSRDRDRRQ